MQTPKKPTMKGLVLCGTTVLGVALGLAGCGGQIQFQGKSALTVVGELPPPPPPPPPPKVEDKGPPPRVVLKDNAIVIGEKIQFEYAKAAIKPESYGLLDEIVGVIKANPQIKKLQIEGHASSDGDDNYNLKLSDDRAKAVRKYFTDKGIAPEALVAKGFGETKPIAPNETEDGKEKNRRVEFNVIEQDVTKKKIEVDPATGKEKVIEESKSLVKSPEADVPAPVADKPAKPAKPAAKPAADKPAKPAKPAADKPAKPAAPKAATPKTPAAPKAAK
jgi:outer membrane protein OmpA-like peptidoglycan-associated protein